MALPTESSAPPPAAPSSSSSVSQHTQRDFLASFTHYIRIDISCTSTNPNAPYELIEGLYDACVQLCSTQLTTTAAAAAAAPVVSAALWPSLFAFSEQEARSSAAARQLRGCFLIGLDVSRDGEDAQKTEERMEDVRGGVAEWQDGVLRMRVFVDEPKVPGLSSKVVAREQLGRLVRDEHMWPRSATSATFFTANGQQESSDLWVAPASQAVDHRESSPGKLRTSEDVLKRLRWDDEFDVDDYNVVYLDRFVGYLEMPVSKWRSDTSDDEFIPLHRITAFRKVSTGEVVWSREARLDKIFNS